MKKLALTTLIAGLLSATAMVAAADEPTTVLFTNVKIFDGTSESLIEGKDVLVEGRLIKQIGSGIRARGATVIDGGGRTLLPASSRPTPT